MSQQLQGLPEEPQRNEWVGIVVRSLLALAVLFGVYAGAAHYLGNRIPSGASVHGVQVGNLTPQTAREVLQTQLESVATDPIQLQAADETLRLDPVAAGLTLDLDTTLGDLTGVSYDPRVIWDRVTDDGQELPLRVRINQEQLQAAVTALAEDFDIEPQEGEVWLARGKVHVADPVPGRALDVASTAAAAAAAWPDSHRADAVVTEVTPQLTTAEIDRFVTAEAEPALAGPVVVNVGGEQARLSPNQLSRLLTVQQSPEHTLSLGVDAAALGEVVRGATSEVEREPADATVQLRDGRPRIVEAAPGVLIDEADLAAKVMAALTAESRTVTVALTEVEPEITTAEAREWKVGEVMAEFTSQFPTGPSNAARTENIRVGLGYLNGTVVMPGEQFSLVETLAPISSGRGYVEAGVISDGRLVKGMGGGLSQVSTAVLNTAWSSGVQLDEFTPHSYYIPRYPVGREATIAVGVIDNRWTNDTTSPIVIEATIDGDTIVMRFWGDRRYTVDTINGSRRNVVEPGKEKVDDSADCLPQHAEEGFDITVIRVLSSAGKEVSRDTYTTRYQPSPEIVCTNPATG